jgi:glycine/sarcosine N-methyltransferase
MAENIKSFYDQLAANYHLIFSDWDSSIRRQGAALQAILERECTAGPVRVLDCACGIGTQMLALASRGFRVTGCDFSVASVERARKEAEIRGLDIPVFVAEMRDLSVLPEQPFDVVICMDNAIPHFETDEQALEALMQIRRKLPKGKLFMASIRDYDALLRERPVIQEPAFYLDDGMRRIVHQVWDWIDERRYILHLYITRETECGWENRHFVSSCRALLRDELSRLLKAAGFMNCRWLLPGESAFYQPIVLATAT